MRRVCLLAIAVLAVMIFPVHAQSGPDRSPADTIRIAETLSRSVDGLTVADASSDQLAETLSDRALDPIDLNHASAADLAALPFLSLAAAHRVVQHRADEGPYQTPADVSAVEGVDAETVRRLRPYVTTSPIGEEGRYPEVPSLSSLTSNLEVELIQRATRTLDPGRGYQMDSSRDGFLGPPGRLTTRLHIRQDPHVELGLTLDKDPGEPVRWAPSYRLYGMDHIAGSLALHDMGRLETLVVGDFTAQFGQGVAMWRGMTFGKGRDPVSPIVRSGRGIVPFSSTAESRYFRGVGGTVSLTPSLSLSAFASHRHRDATPDSSARRSPDAPVPIRTISTGGRHRTWSQLRGKGLLTVRTFGGALEWRHSSLHLGAASYHTRFGNPLRPGDRPYLQFDVTGTTTAMGSVYGTAYLEDAVVFGEVGRSQDGVYGGLIGATLTPAERVSAVILGRHYPPRFSNLYGSAFGDSGGPQNETGVYTGIQIQLTRKWRLSAYLDQYQFPWLRFGVPRSTAGLDARVVVNYDPRPWLSSYLQYRSTSEEAGTQRPGPGGRSLDAVEPEQRQSLRWHTEYRFSDALSLRTRLEGSRAQLGAQTPAYGVLVSQGLQLSLGNLEIDTGLTFFDTDGYAARIYAYEHDLLYSFSVPVFHGEGQRSYVLARYDPLPSLTLEAKYGVTRYVNRNKVGSGLSATPGNHEREIRFQVRWHF